MPSFFIVVVEVSVDIAAADIVVAVEDEESAAAALVGGGTGGAFLSDMLFEAVVLSCRTLGGLGEISVEIWVVEEDEDGGTGLHRAEQSRVQDASISIGNEL